MTPQPGPRPLSERLLALVGDNAIPWAPCAHLPEGFWEQVDADLTEAAALARADEEAGPEVAELQERASRLENTIPVEAYWAQFTEAYIQDLRSWAAALVKLHEAEKRAEKAEAALERVRTLALELQTTCTHRHARKTPRNACWAARAECARKLDAALAGTEVKP